MLYAAGTVRLHPTAAASHHFAVRMIASIGLAHAQSWLVCQPGAVCGHYVYIRPSANVLSCIANRAPHLRCTPRDPICTEHPSVRRLHLPPRSDLAQARLNKNKNKKQIGHHARPRRASATAPLRTGADICKTGSAAGKCAGAKSNTARRRSNHTRTEDQAGREKRANTDASGEWRVHTAVDTPRRNAATRSKHLSFMCQGDIRPRAAAGSSRNGTTQAVAATTGT